MEQTTVHVSSNVPQPRANTCTRRGRSANLASIPNSLRWGDNKFYRESRGINMRRGGVRGEIYEEAKRKH